MCDFAAEFFAFLTSAPSEPAERAEWLARCAVILEAQGLLGQACIVLCDCSLTDHRGSVATGHGDRSSVPRRESKRCTRGLQLWLLGCM